MEDAFARAAQWLSSSPAAAGLPNDVKLEIYGIYKVLTDGLQPTKPRPSLFFPAARAKHDAWLEQGISYRGKETAARERYLGIACGLGWKADEHEEDDEIDWDEEDTKPVAGGGLGTAVSSIRAADSSSGPPLHEAVVSGDLDTVREILEADPKSAHEKGEFGYTPLHLAADRGLTDVVRLLLHAGADVTAQDEDGETPADLARISGQDTVVELLVASAR